MDTVYLSWGKSEANSCLNEDRFFSAVRLFLSYSAYSCRTECHCDSFPILKFELLSKREGNMPASRPCPHRQLGCGQDAHLKTGLQILSWSILIITFLPFPVSVEIRNGILHSCFARLYRGREWGIPCRFQQLFRNPKICSEEIIWGKHIEHLNIYCKYL